ncbi:MAG TPA: hypothetical protein VMH41_01015 [Mycobacteriales bacterium]|nr:hypothetical protein [Mycobacteriales bacterium]
MTTKTRTARAPKGAETRREALLSDFALTPVSDEERFAAALAVCQRATDASDARELLDALGLLDVAIVRGAA